jgi:general secretion pathway protein N
MSLRAVNLSLAIMLYCAGAALPQTTPSVGESDDTRNDLTGGAAIQPATPPRAPEPNHPAAPAAVPIARDADEDSAAPRKTFMNFYAKHVAPKLHPKAVDEPAAETAARPLGVKPPAASAQSDADEVEPTAPPPVLKAVPTKPDTAASTSDPDDDARETATTAIEPVGVKALASFIASHPGAGTVNPLWQIPIATLRATRERPLFSSSRRPPPAPVRQAAPVMQVSAPPEPPAPEQPQLKLVGVVHGAKEDMAIFFDQTGRSVVRLHVGETNDAGWTIKSVDLRAATLEKNSQVVTLELPARSDSSAAAGLDATALALSNARASDE